MNKTIFVREPIGDRELNLPLSIGSDDTATLRVPDLESGNRLELFVENEKLCVRRYGEQMILLDGVELVAGSAFVIHEGGTIVMGATILRLEQESSVARVLSVRHLEGNLTIAPLRSDSGVAITEGDRDLRIDPVQPASVATAESSVTPTAAVQRNWRTVVVMTLVILLLVMSVLLLARFERIEIATLPKDASVSARGLSWSAPGGIFVLPGERELFIAKEGYVSTSRRVTVVKDQPLRLDVRLDELPGIIEIDSGGVAATAFVDGAEVGQVPGEVQLAAGTRTLVLKAERHLDAVETLEVVGKGVRQPLVFKLQPSWGKLAVTAQTPAAVLRIDEGAEITLPATVDLPAGLHRLEISAAAARPWRSAVLIKAGETQQIGPIELGAPDMTLQLRSRPSGAEIIVNGAFSGRTPARLELAPGIEHELLLNLQGYQSVRRSVVAESGQRRDLSIDLPAILVDLTVQGEPAGAQVFRGAELLGTTPLTTRLTAERHRLEIRKDGMQSEVSTVDLSAAVARSLDYRLTPVGRARDWAPPPPAMTAPSGVMLRLMPTAKVILGSERREQGRRANEFQRQVEFTRAFYLGTREVTNGEFRRFRPKHSSGFVGRRTLDLDGFPVTSVSWADAVEYCNWLSEQDGLPAAYEKQGGKWVLRQPVTIGYRLPTEAEWEFVARYTAASGALRRYEWGDALPPPRGYANLAGSEVLNELPQVMDAWQDDYVVVAPPGKFAANALGIFDMTGNVSEWVHDAYVSFDAAAGGKDPLGPSEGNRRVIKGSHWQTHSFSELRPAWREAADAGSQTIGFRVARYAE